VPLTPIPYSWVEARNSHWSHFSNPFLYVQRFSAHGAGWSNSSRALAHPNDATGLQLILLFYPGRFGASGGPVNASNGSVERSHL
jgi:hypothetical protein